MSDRATNSASSSQLPPKEEPAAEGVAAIEDSTLPPVVEAVRLGATSEGALGTTIEEDANDPCWLLSDGVDSSLTLILCDALAWKRPYVVANALNPDAVAKALPIGGD